MKEEEEEARCLNCGQPATRETNHGKYCDACAPLYARPIPISVPAAQEDVSEHANSLCNYCAIRYSVCKPRILKKWNEDCERFVDSEKVCCWDCMHHNTCPTFEEAWCEKDETPETVCRAFEPGESYILNEKELVAHDEQVREDALHSYKTTLLAHLLDIESDFYTENPKMDNLIKRLTRDLGGSEPRRLPPILSNAELRRGMELVAAMETEIPPKTREGWWKNENISILMEKIEFDPVVLFERVLMDLAAYIYKKYKESVEG